jgi:hypothetical protein
MSDTIDDFTNSILERYEPQITKILKMTEYGPDDPEARRRVALELARAVIDARKGSRGRAKGVTDTPLYKLVTLLPYSVGKEDFRIKIEATMPKTNVDKLLAKYSFLKFMMPWSKEGHSKTKKEVSEVVEQPKAKVKDLTRLTHELQKEVDYLKSKVELRSHNLEFKRLERKIDKLSERLSTLDKQIKDLRKPTVLVKRGGREG